MRTIWNAKQAAALAAEIDGEWSRLKLREIWKALRRSRAMDQRELARRSTYGQATISQIENGRIDPPWSTIERIMIALDCDPLVLPRATNDWPKFHSQWRA